MDLVKRMPGCCVNDVCEHFDISRIGVMKHIRILVEAKLLISRKNGRTRELFFNAAPIQLIYDRWTDEYAAFWATQVVDLKYRAERGTRSGTEQKGKPKPVNAKRRKKPTKNKPIKNKRGAK